MDPVITADLAQSSTRGRVFDLASASVSFQKVCGRNVDSRAHIDLALSSGLVRQYSLYAAKWETQHDAPLWFSGNPTDGADRRKYTQQA